MKSFSNLRKTVHALLIISLLVLIPLNQTRAAGIGIGGGGGGEGGSDLPDPAMINNAQLLKNINTDPSESDLIDIMINSGGTIFFASNDIDHGEELWKSDGTEQGTVLVKDIRPGTANSSIQSFKYVGGITYFSANDGTNGAELWKTDGTAAGTVMVKDIKVGSGSSPQNLFDFNGTLYFTASDGIDGYELWKTDGTEAGTVMVKDIYAGDWNSSRPSNFVVFNDYLYFIAESPAPGIWRTDGTTEGTQKIKDFTSVANLISAGGLMFFQAYDESTDYYEMWKSDGTTLGTTLVKDIDAAAGYLDPGVPPKAIGETVFFAARDSAAGLELWKTNGTEGGTVMVKEINLAGDAYPDDFVVFQDALYFSADDGTSIKLWKSDGSALGTVVVKDIYPGGNPSIDVPTVLGANLYFSATDGVNGPELWKSNGTTTGTAMVKNINTRTPIGSYPQALTIKGSELFFGAMDLPHGSSLWKTDGTESGTVMVKDTYLADDSSSPYQFVNVNGKVFFVTDSGAKLWKTNGTESGTVNIATGSFASLTNVSGTLFFATDYALGKSDGTEAGTVTVKTINESGANIARLTDLDGTAIFWADNGDSGQELWKSDGTELGTELLKDINPGLGGSLGSVGSNGYTTLEMGGSLYFVANDGTGDELWKTDGTGPGTVRVKDILTDELFVQDITLIGVLNGQLYFAADDGVNGVELWRTDGTGAGTTLFKEFVAGPTGSYPKGKGVVLGSNLFFLAEEVGNLWKTDGTLENTVRVKDINGGDPSISEMTLMDGVIYFSADDGVNGKEPWRSDGTEAGTYMVGNLRVDESTGSIPGQFTVLGHKIYFAAAQGYDHGSTLQKELWESDGTASGTRVIGNINPSTGKGSSLDDITAGNNMLFMSADDGVHGIEPWILPAPPQHTLTYIAGANGSLTGDASQTVEDGADGSAVTAVPDSGYVFSGWSDASTSNPRTDTGVVDDVTVTAQFAYVPTTGTAVNSGGNGGGSVISSTASRGDGTRTVPLISMGSDASIGSIGGGGTNIHTYQGSTILFQILTSRGSRLETHSFKIVGLDLLTRRLTVEVSSKPQTVTLDLNGTAKLDLDGDSVNDLGITFAGLDVNQVETTLRQLESTPASSVGDSKDSVSEAQLPVSGISLPAPAANRDLANEAKTKLQVKADAKEFNLAILDSSLDLITYYIVYGNSPASIKFGQGERRAIIRDYFETVRRTDIVWDDVERLAIGQIPKARNLTAERQTVTLALPTFKDIFGHAPNFKNATENLAWNTLMYRIRFPRELKKEAQGLKLYRAEYNHDPRSPFGWSVVRVFGYVK